MGLLKDACWGPEYRARNIGLLVLLLLLSLLCLSSGPPLHPPPQGHPAPLLPAWLMWPLSFHMVYVVMVELTCFHFSSRNQNCLTSALCTQTITGALMWSQATPHALERLGPSSSFALQSPAIGIQD